MKPVSPTEVVARILIASLVATPTGMYFGQTILSMLEPLFKSIILFVQKDFSPTLDIVNQNGSAVMRLAPLTVRPYQLTFALRLREGAVLDSVSTNVDHAILPLVIFLTVLIAWPLRNGLQETGARIVLGLVGALLVMGVTTPLFLAARVQMNTVIYAMQQGGNPRQPFLIDWMIFTESGGRWLIPIIVAFICIRLGRSRLG